VSCYNNNKKSSLWIVLEIGGDNIHKSTETHNARMKYLKYSSHSDLNVPQRAGKHDRIENKIRKLIVVQRVTA